MRIEARKRYSNRSTSTGSSVSEAPPTQILPVYFGSFVAEVARKSSYIHGDVKRNELLYRDSDSICLEGACACDGMSASKFGSAWPGNGTIVA